MLDITGCVVTLDALNTQTATAKQIVQAKADYILSVKANESTLDEDLALLFAGFEADNDVPVPHNTAKHVSEGHDRRELGQYWVVMEPEYRAYPRRTASWPRLASLVKLLTIRTTRVRP